MLPPFGTRPPPLPSSHLVGSFMFERPDLQAPVPRPSGLVFGERKSCRKVGSPPTADGVGQGSPDATRPFPADPETGLSGPVREGRRDSQKSRSLSPRTLPSRRPWSGPEGPRLRPCTAREARSQWETKKLPGITHSHPPGSKSRRKVIHENLRSRG